MKFVARMADMSVERLDRGVMVYDTRSHEAFRLDPAAAAVWQACARPSPRAEIRRRAQLDDTVCDAALARLVGLGLVSGEPAGDMPALNHTATYLYTL